MDPNTRMKRIEGLESIKNEALIRSRRGDNDAEVRSFITDGKKALAFELPDREAFQKAVYVAEKYKKSKK